VFCGGFAIQHCCQKFVLSANAFIFGLAYSLLPDDEKALA
jgi:hypothetical protein